jgi:DNA-directed RNA polymerase subunit RPC12/RpoP
MELVKNMQNKRVPPYKCSKCGKEKLETEFFHDKNKSSGLKSWCKDCEKEACRKSNHDLRLEILKHYSNGTITCKSCGFSILDALTVDHIDGGGNEHRRSIGIAHGSEQFYRWLRINKFPKGFQVLCMNCQFIKYKKQRRESGH